MISQRPAVIEKVRLRLLTFESFLKRLIRMKILGTLLAAVALGNTIREDDGSSPNSNTIIMINMNAANVQMNMGDFTDTGASEGIFTDSKSWQYVSPNNREKEIGQRTLSPLFNTTYQRSESSIII